MSATFHDVQRILDRLIGDASAGNHGAFWRGKTRDQFVAHEVFGYPIIDLGAPSQSNLVLALRGQAPFGADINPTDPDAFMPRMPARLPPASKDDIALIENWIAGGCPEFSAAAGLAQAAPSDADHVAYWREVDFFFHPSHGSPETGAHVNRLRLPAWAPLRKHAVLGEGNGEWLAYCAQPKVLESFGYLRVHQTRLIESYYGANQQYLFDCLWKFGGDLLPPDPNSGQDPKHRMNGLMDWCYWMPYVEMSLTQPDRTEADLRLARAWQVGVVADGLWRGRLPIPEFNKSDPQLFQTVSAACANMNAEKLIPDMYARAKAIAAHGGGA